MVDYIMKIRKQVGNSPILTIGCDVIIENEKGDILLLKRTDDGEWCVPGGGMEFGETFMETAIREVMEETGLEVENLTLFGIYSGKDYIVEYPNKDVVFGGIVVFKANQYSGKLISKGSETQELRFFNRENLPQNIRHTHRLVINQWKRNQGSIYVG